MAHASSSVLLVVCGAERVPHQLQPVVDQPGVEAVRLDEAAEVVANGRHHFVAFLGPDDRVDPAAMSRLRREIHDHPDVGIIYGDHDWIDADGCRIRPFRKPGWSPDRLHTDMYLDRSAAYRADLVVAVLDRCVRDGVVDLHQLALRVSEISTAVLHVPQILATLGPCPSAISLATTADALTRHLVRTDTPATAVLVGEELRLVPDLTEFPMVSVIVPTIGSRRVVRGAEMRLVTNLVSSLNRNTSYPELEIVCVLGASAPDGLESELGRLTDIPIRCVRDRRPFNFSEACNLGSVHASGNIYVFLNDDTEISGHDWLHRLVMRIRAPGVGAVGPRLVFEDGRIQHAGVWARGGLAAHRYQGFRADHPGAFGALRASQTCVAVTGACLAVDADHFTAVGGFSPRYPLNYNDYDLCLKLDRIGLRSVIDAGTTLAHFESSSRPAEVDDWEVARFKERWDSVLWDHPLDNPHHVGFWIEEYPGPTAHHTAEQETRLGADVFDSRSLPAHASLRKRTSASAARS